MTQREFDQKFGPFMKAADNVAAAWREFVRHAVPLVPGPARGPFQAVLDKHGDAINLLRALVMALALPQDKGGA